ncbi:MAG: DMT family transporter [Acidimicrobiia bacterium]
MADRSKLGAALALGALAIAWGAIPLLVRNDVPSTGLVGVRVAFGAIALIAVAGFLRKLVWPDQMLGRLIFSGVLLAAHWATFFEAVKHTSVAIALAILYIGPILAALLSGPVLKEHVPPRLWGALAIAAAGTLLVIQPWVSGSDQFVTTRGLVMAAISAALLTALLLIGKPVAQGLGGLTMAIGELTVAAIVLLVPTVRAVQDHPDQMLNFIILGALLTGLAGYVYWEAMARLPLASVSVIMYIEPASAVVWAALFLDEVPNATGWIGVALVLIAGAVAASASAEEEAYGAPATL